MYLFIMIKQNQGVLACGPVNIIQDFEGLWIFCPTSTALRHYYCKTTLTRPVLFFFDGSCAGILDRSFILL